MTERPFAIDAFFDSIEAFEGAMVPSLSCVAIRSEGTWQLFRVRLNYNFANYSREPLQVLTANILVGTFIIEDGAVGSRRIIQSILDGFLIAGGERLEFPLQHGGGYPTTYVPLMPEGVERQYDMALIPQ